MIVIDDFVMLGTTVPEPNSDGRVFVCSAGVSQQLKHLIRIYPLARRSAPSRWHSCTVPLERNPKDSRHESFRICGDRGIDAHDRINDQFKVGREVPPRDRQKLLAPYEVGSIAQANGLRLSLAIIHPDAIDLTFELNPTSPESPQLALFEVAPNESKFGAKRFPYIPRLNFHDEGGWHRLMLRDWGCYELMRKQGDDYARRNMADALHLKPSSSLLVGNLNNQRTAWIVISVLNGIRSAPTLFDSLADDRPVISDKLRRQVYERDGWRCRSCASTEHLTVDHILPHSRGGITELTNLQTLCQDCNTSKGDSLDGAA